MLKYLADVRESWRRGSEIKAKQELLKAQAMAARNEASFAGAMTLQPGHTLVMASGVVTQSVSAPVLSNPSERRQVVVDEQEQLKARPTVDIVKAMSYPGRCYAIWGPQQSGKSWIGRHVLSQLVQDGYRATIVGPKLPYGEWGDCPTFGPDWESVIEGLKSMAALAEYRRRESVRRKVPTQSFTPEYWLIDDWTETVSTLGKPAEQLLVSATTMFASCRIIPIFVLHANTTKSWGNAVGKCLTENFLRVRVIAGFDDLTGKPDPRLSSYAVMMPGDEERKVDHEMIYKRYGYLPQGEPRWPSHETYNETSDETWRETSDDCWSYRGNEVETDWVSHPVSRQVSARVLELPAAPPKVVEVQDRGNWRRFQLTERDGVLARRAYEVRERIGDVVDRMQSIKATKGVRLALAKAMLGMPSPNYRILERGAE